MVDFYNRSENLLKNFYTRGTVNYNQIFNEIHSVNILAGAEVRSSDRQEFYSNGPGYPIFSQEEFHFLITNIISRHWNRTEKSTA